MGDEQERDEMKAKGKYGRANGCKEGGGILQSTGSGAASRLANRGLGERGGWLRGSQRQKGNPYTSIRLLHNSSF